MVLKHKCCFQCSQSLGSKKHRYESGFLQLKDHGGLVKPSRSALIVCEEAVKCFERLLLTTAGELPCLIGIQIAIYVLQNIDISKVFQELKSHTFDSEVENNHVFTLFKRIAKNYCMIRLHHLGKQCTQKLTGIMYTRGWLAENIQQYLTGRACIMCTSKMV